MPVYNGEKFLAEAIDSLSSQTMQDWELIMVNDGSTDRTVEIVNGYGDERIRLISQENTGEGAARNKALDYAIGEYLAFLDADDLFFPKALESNVQYLDQHPNVGVVYSDGYYCDENATPLKRFSASRPCNYEGYILGELAVSPFICAPCCVMIRRSAIEEHAVLFDPELHIGTDWNFLLELARYYPYGYNPEITCRYRVHGGSITFINWQKRSEYIGKIRQRMITLPEFIRLSPEIRTYLLYQLLLETNSGEFKHQQELLQSEQFLALPVHSQARLLRLVAMQGIRLANISRDQVIGLLRSSIRLDPDDWKSKLGLRLYRFFPSGIRILLRLREVVRAASNFS